MISDNIRKYRKENNMSQDELAEKLGVSRQSVSFWENGQTQPTIENIIALANLFNISTDTILQNADGPAKEPDKAPEEKPATGKKNFIIWPIVVIAALAVVGAVLFFVFFGHNIKKLFPDSGSGVNAAVWADVASEDPESDVSGAVSGTVSVSSTAAVSSKPKTSNTSSKKTGSKSSGGSNSTAATSKQAESKQFDLFSYCKDFAIKIGELNGDYCFYQQPASLYGGYGDEYFSISYWGDSNMVEFCLHCPLSDTQSVNFYLRMRGGYKKKYEYLVSKYYRVDYEEIRSATGYIDPAVFSDHYPLSCDKYSGDYEGQNEFMEECRVGICDLIHCLKEFVEVENMECGFSAFEFVNF